jgi:hypothetical protein
MYFLAVMPASYHVNVEKLASGIGHPTRLATEGMCTPTQLALCKLRAVLI